MSLPLYFVQELQAQLAQRAEQYHRLLDQGESMLLARGGEEAGPGATQTQQNLSLLQNKWGSLNSKMDDRRVSLNTENENLRNVQEASFKKNPTLSLNLTGKTG